MSLTKVSYSMIYGAPLSVLDYGADPTGANDSTSAIQNAFNALVATGKSGTLYFPTGTYLCNHILLGSNSVAKGAIRYTIYGEENGVTLLSTVTGSNPFFEIPINWGYGALCDWHIEGLTFQAQTANNGIGFIFDALNWHAKFEFCKFINFKNGLVIQSGIFPRIEMCDFIGNQAAGLTLQQSATGNTTLDVTPSNSRVVKCYFNNNGSGISVNTAGNQQQVVRDCVFEANVNYSITGLGDLSTVDGCWFETAGDIINGSYIGCTFTNNLGIGNSFTAPMFSDAGGNTFSSYTANKNFIVNNGQYANRQENVIPDINTNAVTAAHQFVGTTVNITPSATSGSQNVSWVNVYSAGQPQYQLIAVVISETRSGNGYTYPPILFGIYNNNGTLSSSYIIPSSSPLSVSGNNLVSSVSSLNFYVTRDGSTGSLQVGWSNWTSGTTAISFNLRPVANFS